MIVTNHAKCRCKERSGLPKRAIKGNAEKALKYGIAHKESSGRLKKYFDYLHLSYENKHANNVRLYGDFVYIFNNFVYITMFPIPKAYINVVHKINKRKKKLSGEY